KSTYVNRVNVDGIDALYSKVTVEAGVTRFECLRSVTGECYYTVFPPSCANAKDNRCDPLPVEKFALAKGDSRQLTGLPNFRLCVSGSSEAVAADCRRPVSDDN